MVQDLRALGAFAMRHFGDTEVEGSSSGGWGVGLSQVPRDIPGHPLYPCSLLWTLWCLRPLLDLPMWHSLESYPNPKK